MNAQERFSQEAAGLRPPGRLPLVALALLLGALCVVAAVAAIAHQSAFSEYLTQARRCVELGDCPSRGGRTGGLPLFHGALWIRLLAYSLRAGHDLTWVQSVVLGSWLLSIPLTFLMLRRYLGLRAAALALGLYFPVVLVVTEINILTYTNLLPLPFAAYYASILLFVELRSVFFGALASIALAAAVSAEMGSIVMVPFHLGLVASVARTPIVAVVVSALALAIPFWMESTDAAREIIRQVPTVRFAVGLAISGGVIALAARMGAGARAAESVPAPDRARLVMNAALAYATTAIWLANLFLMSGVPSPRYLVPATFPFLFLIADRMSSLGPRATFAVAALEGLSLSLLAVAPRALEVLQVPVALVMTLLGFATVGRSLMQRGSGRVPTRSLWPVVTICLCAIALAASSIVVAFKRGAAQELTLADAERLVPRLYAAGYTYPQLLASLQGPAADDLMALLTERDPNAFLDPPHLSDPEGSLLVVKVPSAAVPRTQGVIVSVPVDDSTSAIVVRGERSFLDWTRMRRCQAGDGQPPGGYECAEPRRDRPLRQNWPYVELGDPVPRAGPSPIDPASVRFEVPVRTPGHGEPHIVRTANEWPATWRIVRVNGVEFEGSVPGTEIRLPDRREAAGVVEFEFTQAVPGGQPWVWLPYVIEVTQANEHLLEPLRSVR